MKKAKIPYGRQSISEEDIQAVVDVLKSDWLTQGPTVERFEQAVSHYCGCKFAIAVSSGTAALHSAMHAANIGPGDEVITSPLTFVATANSILFQGGTPVFADVSPDTLLLDPSAVEEKITSKTRAIITVDFAGQPCNYNEFQKIAQKYNLKLIADSCHALGAEYKGHKTGTLTDMTIFSFHPVKHIATGEGGMVTTNDRSLAEKMRLFRNHGISSDFKKREKECSWLYEMNSLGFNYRLTDIQCALGLSQLKRLSSFLDRRHEIASMYANAFGTCGDITPLLNQKDINNAYHLYIVKIDFAKLHTSRKGFFIQMRERGIGVNVHYIPVHLQPFYQKKLGTKPGLLPKAEKAYEMILSLPIFPAMTNQEVKYVIDSLFETTALLKKNEYI